MSKDIDWDKFKTKAQKIDLEPSKKEPKISNDELIKMFNLAENNWYTLDDLKEMIGKKITVTVDNPKRTPINSRYFNRMYKLTGEKWTQETAMLNGKRYVRFIKVKEKN
jgi:hypothetical protein